MIQSIMSGPVIAEPQRQITRSSLHDHALAHDRGTVPAAGSGPDSVMIMTCRGLSRRINRLALGIVRTAAGSASLEAGYSIVVPAMS